MIRLLASVALLCGTFLTAVAGTGSGQKDEKLVDRDFLVRAMTCNYAVLKAQ